MIGYKAIYDALITRLQTVTSLPSLQTENNRVTPGSITTPWCRATLLPARTNLETIGPTGYDERKGLLQVDLFYPADSSYVSGFDMADSILGKFVAGTILGSVVVRNSYLQSGQTVLTQNKVIPNYHMFSVLVEWSMYAQRDTIV